MSYISGHFRKGHFRNGKWVSGGYVKGHYSSRSGYGSSLYSTNTTTFNNKQEGTTKSEDEYLNERRAYWKRVREEEGPAPRLDIKVQNKGSNNDIAKIIIISVVVVGIIVGLIIYIDSSVGGSSDGTIGNWFIAILVILALLKKG